MTMMRLKSTPSYGAGYNGGAYNMSYAQPSGGGVAGRVGISGNVSGGPQMGLTLAVASVILVGCYLWTRRVQGARG